MTNRSTETTTGEPAANIAATSSPASRYLAAIIDKIVASGFTLIFYIGSAVVIPIDSLTDQGLILLCGVGYVLYFVLTESIAGRTIGKGLMGLVVVDNTGAKCSWRQSLIRNIVRPVDVNPIIFGGLFPGGIMILTSAYRQRIGDLIAGTYVIESSCIRQKLLPAQETHSSIRETE